MRSSQYKLKRAKTIIEKTSYEVSKAKVGLQSHDVNDDHTVYYLRPSVACVHSICIKLMIIIIIIHQSG